MYVVSLYLRGPHIITPCHARDIQLLRQASLTIGWKKLNMGSVRDGSFCYLRAGIAGGVRPGAVSPVYVKGVPPRQLPHALVDAGPIEGLLRLARGFVEDGVLQHRVGVLLQQIKVWRTMGPISPTAFNPAMSESRISNSPVSLSERRLVHLASGSSGSYDGLYSGTSMPRWEGRTSLRATLSSTEEGRRQSRLPSCHGGARCTHH